MKNYLLILFTINIFFCNGQNDVEFNYENFEKQLLDYKPMQSSEISKKNFDFASMIIRNTKSETKNNPENFNYIDYFNVLTAFLTLRESERKIKMAYEKFKKSDGSCEGFLSFKKYIQNDSKYDIVIDDFNQNFNKCKLNFVEEKKLDIRAYCNENKLNYALVYKIQSINSNDLKYRSSDEPTDWSKQNPLDLKNQKLIDSLYSQYNTYVGKTLVGVEFENTMWSVIQHSNVEMMEKYLPIIKKAFKQKEISLTPFKMLIDRYYGLKYGYQFFGSQSGFGFELADEKKRNKIKIKYGIE